MQNKKQLGVSHIVFVDRIGEALLLSSGHRPWVVKCAPGGDLERAWAGHVGKRVRAGDRVEVGECDGAGFWPSGSKVEGWVIDWGSIKVNRFGEQHISIDLGTVTGWFDAVALREVRGLIGLGGVGSVVQNEVGPFLLLWGKRGDGAVRIVTEIA